MLNKSLLNKSFLNNGGFIWPPCAPTSMQTRQPSVFLPIRHPDSSGRIRHQAFAVGFFGFHYIRATVENAPSLRKDSLRRLQELLADLHIADGPVINLNISAKRSYADFNAVIIRRISLELGDNFSPAVQWMVEFGFHLASVHSFLVAAAECRSSSSLKSNLNYFVSRFPSLLRLARKSEISETLLKPLVESLDVVRHCKTKGGARKSCKLTGLVLSQLLVTNTAVKLLN
jgi:hypothetical protein